MAAPVIAQFLVSLDDCSAGGNVPTPALLAAMLRAADKISDLIFSPGRPPQVQVYGRPIPGQVPGMSVLPPDNTRHIAADLIGDNKQAITTLREHGSCDISYGIPGLARFRANIFIQRGSCAVVLRAIPTAIPDFATLRLPEQLTDLTKLRDGIVLVAGPPGSGKSSHWPCCWTSSTGRSITTSLPSRIPSSSCIITSARPFTSASCTATLQALPMLCARPCGKPPKSSWWAKCAIAKPWRSCSKPPRPDTWFSLA